MTKIRCPKCEHIVGEVDGERITSSVAVRGRGRRVVTAWSQAEFVCDDCGNRWLFKTQSGNSTQSGDIPRGTSGGIP
nr:hypothetical protein [Armatimonas sp.]